MIWNCRLLTPRFRVPCTLCSGETCFQCKFIKRLHFSIVSRENLKIFQCKEKVKISFEVWMIDGYWKLIDFIFVYLFLSSANIENLFYAFNWFFQTTRLWSWWTCSYEALQKSTTSRWSTASKLPSGDKKIFYSATDPDFQAKVVRWSFDLFPQVGQSRHER